MEDESHKEIHQDKVTFNANQREENKTTKVKHNLKVFPTNF